MKEEFTIRYATLSDLESLFEVEVIAWGNASVSKNILQKRLSSPGHYTVVLLENNEIVCFAQVKRVHELDLYGKNNNWYSLMEMESNINGEFLFGYNISARKNRLNSNIGLKALEAAYKVAIDQNCKSMFAGGRMMNYSLWSHCIKPEIYPLLLKHGNHTYCQGNDNNLFIAGKLEYTKENSMWIQEADLIPVESEKSSLILVQSRSLDPIINIYRKATLLDKRAEFIGVIPDYFNDKQSDNFGLLYAWINPNVDVKRHTIDVLNNSFNHIPIFKIN